MNLGLSLALTRRGGLSAEAAVRALFAGGAQGFWFDPSDLTTLWQDTAGTVPVTADGQSVARINDKSGRGHHYIQATAGKRPLYKAGGGLHWLQADGVDDAMATTDTIDLTGGDSFTLWAAWQTSSAVGYKPIIEASAAFDTNAGSITMGHTASFIYGSRGTASATTTGAMTINTTAVLTGLSDISADTCILRKNGAQVGSSATDQGTGNYGNHTWYLFARAGTSGYVSGRLYGAIGIAGLQTPAIGETYLKAKAGVVF